MVEAGIGINPGASLRANIYYTPYYFTAIMKLRYSLFLLFVLGTTPVFPQIYVAPDGDDTHPGTLTQPLESIQQAQALASPGDTVLIRGGLYPIREDQISQIQQNLFACVSFLTKSGLPGQPINYWAYPGETPVFDFSNVAPAGRRVVGIWVDQGTEYIHLKGLEMTGIRVTILSHTESYCIYSRGSNNIFEQINMHDNVGTGLRHFSGGGNLFLNCDAYNNHDSVSEDGLGSNTDGFGCHTNPGGSGNVFRGCRAWLNSDDGFDIIRSDESVLFENCWAFYNGYSTSFQSLGDGNGFKAGGYAYDPANEIPNPVPRNTVRFCVAVRNKANPFTPRTNIRYTLSEPGYIKVSVYNIFGQKIHVLVGEHQRSGEFTVSWNGENDLGVAVAPGVYFYRLSISNSSGSHAIQKKMIRLK